MNEYQRRNLSRPNLPTRTAGGIQFWTDHVHRSGYRIQQHAISGHWRLLDPADVRRGWGTRRQCEAMLDHLLPIDHCLDDSSQTATTLLLHGLLRSRQCMKPMQDELMRRGHRNVIRMSYASSRQSLAGHAEALRSVVEGLPDETRLNFVGHSMGNIVIRHLIGDLQRDGDPARVLRRCRSMVMLGPPNQGASIARRLSATGLFGVVTGRGGMELGPRWKEIESLLAVPPFPFAIIAGDVSAGGMTNPLIHRCSDLLVCVEETRLEGAAEFATLPIAHRNLMRAPEATRMTIDFLERHGELRQDPGATDPLAGRG